MPGISSISENPCKVRGCLRRHCSPATSQEPLRNLPKSLPRDWTQSRPTTNSVNARNLSLRPNHVDQLPTERRHLRPLYSPLQSLRMQQPQYPDDDGTQNWRCTKFESPYYLNYFDLLIRMVRNNAILPGFPNTLLHKPNVFGVKALSLT